MLPAERAGDPLLADPPQPAPLGRIVEQRRTRRRRTRRCRCRARSERRRPRRPAPRAGRTRRSAGRTAMYSRTLFIVETSLSGLCGSGDRHDVRGREVARAGRSSGMRPVNVHVVRRARARARAPASRSKQSPAPTNDGVPVVRPHRRAARRAPAARSRRRPADPSRRGSRAGAACPASAPASGRRRVNRLEVGRAAHHEDVAPGALPPRSSATSPVALVGGDDDVGRPVGQPLRARTTRAVQQVLAAAEARQVQLGHQVVLVEDEPRAAPLQRQRDAGTAGPAGCRCGRRRTGRGGGPAARSARAPSPYSRR